MLSNKIENQNTKDKPLISIILAVKNEAESIEGAVRSLLKQRNENIDFEILVVDGVSQDKTKDIVKDLIKDSKGKLKLLTNEKQITPAAFNEGIKEANGSFVAILGAHCQYAENYLETCYEELIKTSSVGCSGVVFSEPANARWEAELVASIMNSKFGVSASSFRTVKAGYSNTIPYGVFLKSALIEVGGYDETLVRNQDNDMNHKLRFAGYKLFMTDKTYCIYHPKSTVAGLLSYGRTNGKWNAFTLLHGSMSLELKHFIPFIFFGGILFLFLVIVAYLIIGYKTIITLAFGLLLFILSLHIMAGLLFSLKQKNKGYNLVLFPIVVFLFHFNYGLGTFIGFLSFKQNFKNKKSDNKL